jgi:hypothetical protein
VCFDDVLYTTLYVKATIVSGIVDFQREFSRPGFIQGIFFPGMSLDTIYTKNTQRQTISGLLGTAQWADQLFDSTTDYYLSRGHLSAMADFVYGSQQSATFHFVNVSPQWQTFNGGNWERLESSVRAYAIKTKLDLIVYTGTYGVATLPNVNGTETELYLYVDSNNNKRIPVPKLFWKAVYDPKSQAGVVFVGINNPYISDPKADYLICTDVCPEISWVNWDQQNITAGYSYCCEVGDFNSTVQFLPEFTVSGLLTEGESTNNNSSLRLGQYLTMILVIAVVLIPLTALIATELRSRMNRETLSLKCNSKVFTLPEPIQIATTFFVSFIAMKGAQLKIAQFKSRMLQEFQNTCHS